MRADIIILILLSVFFLKSCKPRDEKQKVMYINSYHSSFPPSQQITEGVFESLSPDSFEITVHFMDTKRNSSEAFIKKRVSELLDSIHSERPDILILSDDNALKYLLLPNIHTIEIPVVFCGINWTADQYKLPTQGVTGILEVLPLEELVQTLKPYYPEMKKLLVLNENTTTSRKTKPVLDTVLNDQGILVSQELVDDFESWKSVFVRANQNYDIIYLQTRGAIKNWNHDEALNIIKEYIKIPLVTCEEFMMPYAVLGLTQISKEQGFLAGEAAKRILRGTNPSDIPITKNQLSKIWINTDLAEKIGFTPDKELLKQAKIVSK